MYPSTAISYELAQARITDLRHQARRASVARAAQAELQDGGGRGQRRWVHQRNHLSQPQTRRFTV
jgi:hypothetical protein